MKLKAYNIPRSDMRMRCNKCLKIIKHHEFSRLVPGPRSRFPMIGRCCWILKLSTRQTSKEVVKLEE